MYLAEGSGKRRQLATRQGVLKALPRLLGPEYDSSAPEAACAALERLLALGALTEADMPPWEWQRDRCVPGQQQRSQERSRPNGLGSGRQEFN